MSEARPITNVTDFVCGACWNSFSKLDKGVNQGDHVICPHCGHKMPVAGARANVVAAVNAAEVSPDRSPDGFGALGGPTLPGIVLATEQGFPELDRGPGYAWMPPDLVARSSEPAGFVVGEPDDVEDFDFSEPTLRPDESQDELLAQVRHMTTPPSIEPIDFGVDITAAPAAALVARNEPAAASPPAPQAAGEGDAKVSAPGEIGPGDAVLHGDWKLRALGLTYNFHGLDALLGRAASKTGQAMQVSIDGVTWKDFEAFLVLYRSGLSASKAIDLAREPGSAPVVPPAAAGPQSGGRSPRQTQTRLTAPEAAPTQKADDKARTSQAKDRDSVGQVGRPTSVLPASKPSVGPNSPPSRRMPVVRAEGDAGSRRGVLVAAAVVAVAIGAVAILAWQGVISLPFLL